MNRCRHAHSGPPRTILSCFDGIAWEQSKILVLPRPTRCLHPPTDLRLLCEGKRFSSVDTFELNCFVSRQPLSIPKTSSQNAQCLNVSWVLPPGSLPFLPPVPARTCRRGAQSPRRGSGSPAIALPLLIDTVQPRHAD